MDAKEVARGLVVEHREGLVQLSVNQMKCVARPKGFFDARDEIAAEIKYLLSEFFPEAEFQVTNAGRDDYQIKRVA